MLRFRLFLPLLFLALANAPLWAKPIPAEIDRAQVIANGNGIQVEIHANAPLTYAYYRLEPLLAVIDIAPAVPGQSLDAKALQSAYFSAVKVETKYLGELPMTRLVFFLKEEMTFSVQRSPESKGRLLATFGTASKRPASPASGANVEDNTMSLDQVAAQVTGSLAAKPDGIDQQPATAAGPAAPLTHKTDVAEIGAAPSRSQAENEPGRPQDPSATILGSEPTMPGAISPPPAPAIQAMLVKPALQPVVPSTAPPAARTVSAVKVTDSAIIIVTGSPVEKKKTFKLTKPSRLVIDLPGLKNSMAGYDQAINRFGFRKVRFGTYADKVRIVFDLEKEAFPSYDIEKSGEGLVLRFNRTH